jgi:hypothetical protein
MLNAPSGICVNVRKLLSGIRLEVERVPSKESTLRWLNGMLGSMRDNLEVRAH